MNCIVCGFQIPAGAKVCPNCGTLAPEAGGSGVSYSSPTIPPSGYQIQGQPPVPAYSSPEQPVQIPTSSYGLDPYNAPPPYPPATPSYDPYAGQYPYGMIQQPQQMPPPLPMPPPMLPPTPQPSGQGKRTWLIVGIVLLIVVLVGEGGYLLLSRRPAPNTLQTAPTATTVITPTPTPNLSQNPYAPGTGTLVLNDSMHDNSKGYKWDQATMDDTANKGGKSVCGFSGGAYHVSRTNKGALICDPEATFLTLGNVAFEINVSIAQGSESGLLVRFDQTKGMGYLLSINIDGGYAIDMTNFNATNPNDHYKLLHSGTNAAIKTGLNQVNVLALVANGTTIAVYVNNQFVDTIQDKTLTNGQLGIFGYGDNASDIVVSSARAWKL